MPHDCIDWTARPPLRRLPLFVLSCGDDHVYTPVPRDLKQLEQLARNAFDLGDADLRFLSSCVNHCNGLPARITESAWEHLSPLIGCATVEVAGARTPQAHENVVASERADAHMSGDTSPSGRDEPSDHARAPTPDKEFGDADSPRQARHKRRLVSEDDADASDESEQAPAVKRERQTGYRSEPDSQTSEQPDNHDIGTDSQPQTETLVQAHGSNVIQKLMIRVAHRPSKQESKFTTKSTTKVHKVLSGVCKSFGLDVSRATLYLIVSTEDEDGEVENLFPCDKNDTISRAGAERDTESKFLLKMAGEA